MTNKKPLPVERVKAIFDDKIANAPTKEEKQKWKLLQTYICESPVAFNRLIASIGK